MDMQTCRLPEKNVLMICCAGVETKRMGNFFKLNTSVYTQKDLTNKFAQVYIDASAKAIET